MERTPNQRIASDLLGRSVIDYIGEKRDAVPRWSWRLIARQLHTDTDGLVDVTPEALRQWHGEMEGAA